MKVYISLPITGKDLQEQKSYAGNIAAILSEYGHTPVNPFDNGLADDASYEEHMKADLRLMLDCDAICLCKGYHYSKGCLFERDVAVKCGMAIVKDTMPMNKICRILKSRKHEGDKV